MLSILFFVAPQSLSPLGGRGTNGGGKRKGKRQKVVDR